MIASRLSIKWLLVTWAVYWLGAIPAAVFFRDTIHPDAVSYLQAASYLTEGRAGDSVSGYWSPLLIWIIAFFQFIGLAGLLAGRAAMILCGSGLLAALFFFL